MQPNQQISHTPSQAIKFQNNAQHSIACGYCSLSNLCLPVGIDPTDVTKLDKIITHHEPLKRGQHWFRAGDPFKAVFAVRSGCVKTYIVTKTGEEQICGFHLPGELIGLDAIDCGYYKTSAKVVQTSSVCEIPFLQLESAFCDIPNLQRQMLRVMSKELDNEQWVITLLGRTTADTRVAAFLCNISKRFAIRGYSAYEFVLAMSRNDIANFLGLAVETVCRVFTRFQKNKLLNAKGKHIIVNDLEQLYEIAGTLEIPSYVTNS